MLQSPFSNLRKFGHHNSSYPLVIRIRKKDEEKDIW